LVGRIGPASPIYGSRQSEKGHHCNKDGAPFGLPAGAGRCRKLICHIVETQRSTTKHFATMGEASAQHLQIGTLWETLGAPPSTFPTFRIDEFRRAREDLEPGFYISPTRRSISSGVINPFFCRPPISRNSRVVGTVRVSTQMVSKTESLLAAKRSSAPAVPRVGPDNPPSPTGDQAGVEFGEARWRVTDTPCEHWRACRIAIAGMGYVMARRRSASKK
jgi:hypothetical protein